MSNVPSIRAIGEAVGADEGVAVADVAAGVGAGGDADAAAGAEGPPGVEHAATASSASSPGKARCLTLGA